ncbi:MAG TPA: 3-hydroxyacyl-CoA dehydrogenase/enoyl-CoA hydratase family protein, partial [bacterium]
MGFRIKKVAILGAGIMGSGIAAHLAGAGIPSCLLDIVPKELADEEKKAGLTLNDKIVRNRFALKGIDNILKSKPALIYSPKDVSLITPGNMEDNMDWLKDVDWIIEVVVERLDIKKKVFEMVDRIRKPEAIISSNTSGIRLRDMAEGRSPGFRKHFLITHFFNPVRYMRLVEIIKGDETSNEAVKYMTDFIENILGKGVVFGKDTPNFIANRIGIFSMLDTIKVMLDDKYEVDEVDAIVGRPMGRPGSAAFGTADLVGLDTFVHVASNVYETATNDEKREIFNVPEFIKKMVKKNQLGNKTGQGFYKREKKESGEKTKLVLDYNTFEYREAKKYKYDSLGAVKNIDDPAEKAKTILGTDDRASQLIWKVLRDTFIYSINRIPEIADDIVNIDNAMKWGFNWALGPFETWDAIGVKSSIERMEKEGINVSEKAKLVAATAEGTFYKDVNGRKHYFDFNTKSYKEVPVRENVTNIDILKKQNKIINENSSARLIDIGDGVICLEFFSKMNSIDGDIIAMINAGIDKLEKNYEAMVIGNNGENFSVGANIFMILAAAQAKEWKQLEEIVKNFQDANMRIKYASKPIVSAPFGMTLGGGAEVAMHAHRVRVHAELYMGLVEVGVGLLPGGGGCKEVLIRALGSGPVQPDLMKATIHTFEAIGMAKVSMSAKEAQEKMGLLRPVDSISLN